MSDRERRLKIVRWAQAHLGTRVERGECWDLANQALRAAGARGANTKRPGANYRWGAPISPAAARPGDVIQFRNHVMTTIVTTIVTFDDGSGYDRPGVIKSVHRPHHTAIVAENHGAQGVDVYEQNLRDVRTVQRNTLWLASTGAVVMKAERRDMLDSDGKLRPAQVVEKRTIQVTGQIWAYRPQPKSEKVVDRARGPAAHGHVHHRP